MQNKLQQPVEVCIEWRQSLATDLGALYTRLKNAGALTWSDGGVTTLRDGTRAVILRDPEIGAFAKLFEKAKK